VVTSRRRAFGKKRICKCAEDRVKDGRGVGEGEGHLAVSVARKGRSRRKGRRKTSSETFDINEIAFYWSIDYIQGSVEVDEETESKSLLLHAYGGVGHDEVEGPHAVTAQKKGEQGLLKGQKVVCKGERKLNEERKKGGRVGEGRRQIPTAYGKRGKGSRGQMYREHSALEQERKGATNVGHQLRKKGAGKRGTSA